MFFIARERFTGYELWISNGTDAGTQLVKNIRPDSVSSLPRYLTNVNGTLFFQAHDGSIGLELWRSNGTEGSTQLVKDIWSGFNWGIPRYLTNVNGTLFFRARESSTGYELWMSNGTEAGTQLVKDIRAGSNGASPRYLTNVDGTLFFSANDGSTGYEIWRSDGTSAGTQLVKEIFDGAISSYPKYLTNVNGTLFFRAFENSTSYELWTSNGTEAGTQLVKDIQFGSSSTPKYLTNANGTLFFQANDGIHGAEVWVLEDTEVPTLGITPDGGATNESPITFTFQFSEFVFNFDTSDVMVTGGAKGTFTAIDRDTFTLVITPSGDGLVTVSVADDVAEDASGNLLLGDSATIEYDGTTPTLMITPDSGITNNFPITFTFEFSEDIIDFIESDISITGGLGSNFTMVDGDTYTIDVTPSADGNVTVSVANDLAEDDAGNLLVGDSVTIEYDGTAPTLMITPDGTLTNSEILLFTFEFSEDVTGFTTEDIVVTNGTKGFFSTTDGNTYTLSVTPTADGDVTVTVASAVAQDAAGNENIGDIATVEYDGTAPTVSVSPENELTNLATTVFTFEFSEEVFGFTADDVMVTNGTKGTFTEVDGDTYTLEVTAMADGDVIVNALADGAMDAAGNGNQIGSATVTYDGTAPTLDITPDGIATNDNPITFTFQFSEDVVGFTIDDLAVVGGSKGTLMMIDGNTYTMDVTPSGEGNLIVAVEDGFAADAAGNLLVGDGVIVEYDSIAPTLTITPDGLVTNLNSTIFTFQFSEVVTGFTIDDVFLSNGTKGTFIPVDGDTYELEVFSPCSSGDLIIAVLDDAAQDAAGNGNIGDSAAITYDNVAPTLEITPDGSANNQGSTLFTFQFSEAVTGFTIDDVDLMSNGPNLSTGMLNAVDEDTYTLEVFHSNGNGDVIVSVSADEAFDAAGNGNTGDSATITFDDIAPTLMITPENLSTNANPITFTFQFSEEIFEFIESDINISGGSGSNFTMVDGILIRSM
ncbi:Hypothetical protein PBC10988_34830 [Planctomycetales bacterium 10988]|nr:Hypothetical protein PBC10988_34830 [Planctomycetales bacterium 10988]